MSERVRNFMHERLGAETLGRHPHLNWEIDGPENTSVDKIQCWSIAAGSGKGIRLVIVEIYDNESGFDVFPQVLDNTLDGTAHFIEHMDQFEA